MVRATGYRYEATSVAGFVQQLAVSYLKNCYWFYVMGSIRPEKDPRPIDEEIIRKYKIALSKAGRYRRKRTGTANLQYLRFESTYIIIATPGEHEFLRAERDAIRDAREVPIKFRGYSLSFRGGHAHVRIERERFKELKAHFEEISVRRTEHQLAAELWSLPWQPYAPVRGQYLGLLREINRRRKAAGLEPVPETAVRLRRQICRPFEPVTPTPPPQQEASPG